MNRYRCKIIALALAAFFVPGACTQEDAPETVTPGTLALQLQLSLPIETEIVTRATTIAIDNVWVIQYITASENGGSSSKMIAKHYENAAGNSNVISWEGDKCKVTTDADFENKNSEFYIITNAGSTHAGLSALGETSDLAALKACVKEIKDTPLVLGDIITEPGVLVAGPVKFAKRNNGNNNFTASISAHLQRANAKVTVTWNAASDVFTNAAFTATSLTVENLPKTISFFERAGAESGAYPAESDISTDAIVFSELSSGSVSFYMAENLRGAGTSTTAQGKNLVANGPIAESGVASLTGCTCITLSGDYKYDSSHTGVVGVKYRFYPGGNLINDYNIRRGYAYALNITVSGVNSADLRVTITDGNVAIFDQVTEIGEIEVEI